MMQMQFFFTPDSAYIFCPKHMIVYAHSMEIAKLFYHLSGHWQITHRKKGDHREWRLRRKIFAKKWPKCTMVCDSQRIICYLQREKVSKAKSKRIVQIWERGFLLRKRGRYLKQNWNTTKQIFFGYRFSSHCLYEK